MRLGIYGLKESERKIFYNYWRDKTIYEEPYFVQTIALIDGFVGSQFFMVIFDEINALFKYIIENINVKIDEEVVVSFQKIMRD